MIEPVRPAPEGWLWSIVWRRRQPEDRPGEHDSSEESDDGSDAESAASKSAVPENGGHIVDLRI